MADGGSTPFDATAPHPALRGPSTGPASTNPRPARAVRFDAVIVLANAVLWTAVIQAGGVSHTSATTHPAFSGYPHDAWLSDRSLGVSRPSCRLATPRARFRAWGVCRLARL